MFHLRYSNPLLMLLLLLLLRLSLKETTVTHYLVYAICYWFFFHFTFCTFSLYNIKTQKCLNEKLLPFASFAHFRFCCMRWTKKYKYNTVDNNTMDYHRWWRWSYWRQRVYTHCSKGSIYLLYYLFHILLYAMWFFIFAFYFYFLHFSARKMDDVYVQTIISYKYIKNHLNCSVH